MCLFEGERNYSYEISKIGRFHFPNMNEKATIMLYRFYIPELLFIFIISLLHICSISILMSSNINEVYQGSFKLFIFFYEKILFAPKAPKAPRAQKGQKAQKALKNTKYNRAKAQNANK